MRTHRRSPSLLHRTIDLLLAGTLALGCGSASSPGSPPSSTGGSGGSSGHAGSGGSAGAPSGSGGAAPGDGGSSGEAGSGGPGDDAGPGDASLPDGGGTAPDGGTPLPPPADDPAPVCMHEIDVTTSVTLATALAAAKPGDCVVLADGDYAFPVISAKGTEAAPILVKAANPLKATVSTGKLDLEGATWVIVQGITWQSVGAIKINDCIHCRLSRCRLQLKETAGGTADNDWVTVTGTSNNCRVDHNELGPKVQIGNMIMLAGVGDQIVQNTHVDHNYFHDVKRSTGNGWETIRAGLSSWTFSVAHSLIERNLFERTDGDPEVISIKSSMNVIRWNTMRGSAGQFVLRHGNGSMLYGNFILGNGVAGAGGIRVHGGNHRIYNNYVQGITGDGIQLEGGESDDKTGMLTDHKQVYRTQVLFNTLIGSPLVMGGAHPMDPVDCVVANNLVSGAPITQTATTKNTQFVGNIVTGTGGITTGVKNVDPKLMKAGELMRLGAGSPAIDAADPTFTVMDDGEGLPRSKPDVGAEEWSSDPSEPAPAGVLTAKDVGPLAP